MHLLKSAWYLFGGIVKRWWTVLPSLLTDPFDILNKFIFPWLRIERNVDMPVGLFPYVFCLGIVIAAIMTYHELRMQMVALETTLESQPPTRRETLNAFLDGCLSALDRLLLKPQLTRHDLFPWRDRLAEGLKGMTGQNPVWNQEQFIPYHQFIQVFDQMPSETHNRDFVREPLRRCRQHIEELRTSIKSYHLVVFEPSDLPHWEDIQ